MRYLPGESSPWYTSQVVLIRTLIGAEQEVELDMAGALGNAAATQETVLDKRVYGQSSRTIGLKEDKWVQKNKMARTDNWELKDIRCKY